MKIHFVTLALDALPFLTFHLPTFRQLPVPWEWSIIEGVAAPKGCTSWVKDVPGRLSNDGSTQYLDSIAYDPRIHIYRAPKWPGKCAMLNYALERIKEPCLLWQVDADEVWDARSIKNVAGMFNCDPTKNCAYFLCRYFVGPDLAITTVDTFGNNRSYEWLRVWRFIPGQRFESHEPPILNGFVPKPFTHDMTRGFIFDHFAYATEAQVRFKQEYYAGPGNPVGHLYKDLLDHWRRLQANDKWPVPLRDFFPFVKDGAMVDRIKIV